MLLDRVIFSLILDALLTPKVENPALKVHMNLLATVGKFSWPTTAKHKCSCAS